MDTSKSAISTHKLTGTPHEFFAQAAKGNLQFNNLRELNEKIHDYTMQAFHNLPNYSRYFQQGQMHLVVDHVRSCRVSILGLIIGLFTHGLQWVIDTFRQNKVLDVHVKELNILAVKVEHCLVDRTLKTLSVCTRNITKMISTDATLNLEYIGHFKACMKELERMRAAAIRAVLFYEKMLLPVGIDLEKLEKNSILSAANLAYEKGLRKLQQYVIQAHSRPSEGSHIASATTTPKPAVISSPVLALPPSSESNHVASAAATAKPAVLPSPVLALPPSAETKRVTSPLVPTIDPWKGIPTVLCGGKKVALGIKGIGNPNAACYTIAALQSIRFNPQLRHLVDRKIPSTEYFNGKMLPISPEKYTKLENFQSQLRNIFIRLDQGQMIPQADMTKLNWNMHYTLGWHSLLPAQTDFSECYMWILDQLLFNTPDEDTPPIATSAVASTVAKSSDLGAQLRTSYLLDMTNLELGRHHGLEENVVLGGGITSNSVIAIELVKAQASRGEPQSTFPTVDFSASNPIQTLEALHSGATPHHDLFTVTSEDTSELAQTLREHVHIPFDPAIHKTGVVVEKMAVATKGAKPTLKKFYAGEATSKMEFCNAPATLMFSLKRFEHIGHGGHPVRLGGPVEIPMEMDLSKLAAISTSMRPLLGSMMYQLASVTVHTGSAGGGHYYMYRRTDDGGWICCNDSQVTKVPDFDPSTLEGSYMLIYEKKTTSTQTEVFG